MTFWEMALRALIVYVTAVMMVRMGKKRFLGKNTAFDAILGIVLGAVLSRAINGSAPFWETLGAGFVLVGIHWLFAVLAFRWDGFGTLIKGRDRVLVRDGEIQWDEMAVSNISEDDLLSALRSTGNLEDVSKVEVAYLERGGDVSVIKQKREPKPPQIVEIRVEDGVQTVRLEMN